MARNPVRPVAVLFCLVITSAAHAEVPNYEQQIKPLFRRHCLKCHNLDEPNGELDLSSFAAVMKGGSSGAVVKPGRPEGSQLYRAIAHLEGAEAMPPESPKLSETDRAMVRNWIQGGVLAGKGAPSLLRSVAVLDAANVDVARAVMPNDLLRVAITPTVRPPVPQALAASPGAPLFAVSGQEQILLYGAAPTRVSRPEPKADAELKRDDPARQPFALLGALPFSEGTIHVLRFSRNGSLLLAAGGRGAQSGRVVLHDVESGRRVAEIGDEADSVLAADVSSDHRLVALGGPQKVVKIYSTQNGELLQRIDKHTDWITALEFSPDGKRLATADRSGGIHVWEAEQGAILFTLDEHKVRVTDLSWRRDGKLLASVAEDGNLILWDMEDGWPSRNTTAHAARATSRYRRATGALGVEFSHDGRLLTIGRDGRLRQWSAAGEKTADIAVAGGLPTAAAYLSRSGLAVTGSFQGQLQLWDLASGTAVQVLTTGPADR